MTRIDGPRPATAEEFADVTGLADRVFGRERGGMAARRPHTYDPDAPERHAVIVKDGEVVSTAAAIPETLVVDGGAVECWGIGGVATDPRERGNGHMSDILSFWLARMDEDGVPLSELGGDRQRYNHFGWESAGRTLIATITERSLPAIDVDASRVVAYDGSDRHVEAIRSIHGDEPFRVNRDPNRTRQVLSKRGMETVLCRSGRGEVSAYLCFERESRSRTVLEFGGTATGLRTLIGHAFAAFDTTELSVTLPPEHGRWSVIRAMSADWHVRPARMLNVRDLGAVLRAFAGQIETALRRAHGVRTGVVTLGVEGETPVALTWDGEAVLVEPIDDDPTVALDRLAMTRLLFGDAGSTTEIGRRHPLLDVALPLRFHVWLADRV